MSNDKLPNTGETNLSPLSPAQRLDAAAQEITRVSAELNHLYGLFEKQLGAIKFIVSDVLEETCKALNAPYPAVRAQHVRNIQFQLETLRECL